MQIHYVESFENKSLTDEAKAIIGPGPYNAAVHQYVLQYETNPPEFYTVWAYKDLLFIGKSPPTWVYKACEFFIYDGQIVSTGLRKYFDRSSSLAVQAGENTGDVGGDQSDVPSRGSDHHSGHAGKRS